MTMPYCMIDIKAFRLLAGRIWDTREGLLKSKEDLTTNRGPVSTGIRRKTSTMCPLQVVGCVNGNVAWGRRAQAYALTGHDGFEGIGA